MARRLLAEQDGNSDFTVFSTWLSPFISRKLTQGSHYGTIEGHILAMDACQGHPKEMLLDRSRWLFPLFSEKYYHWVSGYLELGAREFHIFDGYPELNLDVWAEPETSVGKSWVACTIKVPLQLTCPVDVPNERLGLWFFTIHAMQVLAKGQSTVTVTNEHTKLLEMEITSESMDEVPDIQMTAISIEALDDSSMNNPPIDGVESKPESLAAKDTHSDMVNELKTTSSRSRTAVGGCQGIPQCLYARDEAKENVSTTCANRSLIGPNCRGPACWHYCITEFIRSSNHLARETPTSKDTASRAVHNPEVTSGPYKPDNWVQHEGKCPKITGLCEVQKVLKTPSSKPVVESPNSITLFFTRKLKGQSDTSQPLKETAVTQDSGSDSETEPSKGKQKITDFAYSSWDPKYRWYFFHLGPSSIPLQSPL
ncbi:hypothetical protein B0H14DRAFT_2632326 [Mycena olivaceomarginata]|nr:hypothetical protein B0H14DRAFT_2632326 [Mycena olivaceomarginata]